MNAIKWIYKKILSIYDKYTAKQCKVSLGDIMHQRYTIEQNQFLVAAKLLDIENYVFRSIKTFVYQNTISRKAYGKKHREEDGNKSFECLIKSYQTSGYDENSILSIDSDFRLLDGNHRMGMNIFYNIEAINVRVLKRKSKNKETIEWYLEKAIDGEFILCVLQKYKMIQEMLLSCGDAFCCVINSESKLLKKELEYLTHVHRSLTYSDCHLDGGGVIPAEGEMILFTLDKPSYKITRGFVVSKRAKEIESIMKIRYPNSNIYITRSCLEGKKLFDIIKPYVGKNNKEI